MFRDTGYTWKYNGKKGKLLTPKEFDKLTSNIIREMGATTKPFKDNSEAAKQKRKKRAAKDYEYFARTYLPHYFFKPFGKIHKELIGYCETGGKSLNAVAYPREHGKSAIASFGKPLQLALTGQSPYSIILSDTNDLASEMIQWIKIECEENARIRQDFGVNIKTEGWWEKDDIVLFGRHRIRGMGRRQKIRGTRFMQFRPVYIVGDDLENNINVKNKKLVKETVEWLLGSVYGSLADNGTLLDVGTMLDKDSVLSNLIKHIFDKAEEFEMLFGIKAMNAAVYAAIIDEGTANERPVWPEGKTLEKLKQIRYVVGPIVWASEFQNDPVDQGQYKLDWIQGFTREIVFLTPTQYLYFSGSDPSAKADEQADYKAHTVIALDEKKKKRYVAECWIKKAIMEDFHKAYIDLYIEYHMRLSGYETNGFQLFIKLELEELCKELELWPNFLEINHSSNKFERIGRWAGMTKRGELQFCRNHSDQEICIRQLNQLGTKANDDGADSLDMAIETSMNYRGEFSFKSSGKRMGGGSKRFSANLRREMMN